MDVLLAVLTFLTLLAVSMLGFLYYRMFRATLFTVVKAKVIVSITHPTGSLATFTKELKLRANHKGITQYIHRNLSADGTMQNFKVDGTAITPQKDAGDYLVIVNFDRPLHWGETRDTTLTFDIIDSFLATTEWVTYLLTYPTKELAIEVNLPAARPASNAEIYCLRGGEIEPVPVKPHLSEDHLQIVWTAKELHDLGLEYRLQWTWPG